jgi:hypothetical protein
MLFGEISYRRLNAFFGLLGVGGAAALLVGILASLEIHATRSEAIVRRRQAETRTAMQQLQADVRDAMHHLGYNAVALPKDQSLEDWYAEDYARQVMPETDCRRLDATQDLLDRYVPRLRQKIHWSQKRWTVIVVGVGRERVLDTSVCPDRALVDDIAPGHCVVGFELHQALELTPGETIDVLDRSFVIDRCRDESGTKDDITLWLNLADAQKLLGQPGMINEILLVEHLSVWGRLAEVRRRCAAVLPDCQVVEMASETMSRAHARVQVADEARAAIEREQKRQAMLQAERARILQTVVPPGLLVCVLWVGGLTYWNVRDRSRELGVLMAQGFRAAFVRRLILAKALLQGLVGGALGFGLGVAVAVAWQGWAAAGAPLPLAAGLWFLGLSVMTSVAVCLAGSWLPAWLAVRTDPAVVLRQE